MSDDLARARAREAACLWMLNKHPEGADFNRDDMIAAFVEGYQTRLNHDVLGGDELALTATVLDAASRGGPFTKTDAARAAKAVLVARDRIERLIKGQAALSDQRAIENAIGQRQLDDATALMREAVDQFRAYERHHLDKIGTLIATVPDDPGQATRQIEDTTRKANVNALLAMRLEAWLAGKDQYPTSFERDLHGWTTRIELPRAHDGPGSMSPDEVKAQEAFVSAAIDAGICEVGERDEPVLMMAPETGPGLQDFPSDHIMSPPTPDSPVIPEGPEIPKSPPFASATPDHMRPIRVSPSVAAMSASIDEISSLPEAPAQSPCDMCPGEYPTPAAAASDGKSPRDLVADDPDPLAALVHARNWLISAESLIAEAAEFIRGVTGANPGSDSADLCQRLDAWLTPMATRPADEGAEKDARRSSATHQGDNHG